MYDNKKVLVVGAAGLLGAELVKSLLFRGATVIAADINTAVLEEKLEGLNNYCQNKKLILRFVDLSSKNSISKLLDDYDDINGAVNCAYPKNINYGKHFFEVNLDDFNENISLNIGSFFLFMQQCAAYYNKH